jgi:hypothetical protein
MNELERHFSGDAPQSFYDHLAVCPDCRAEVAAMDELSLALRELKAEPGTAPEPRLGFYTRVASGIIDRRNKEAWGLFSPGAAFFRRVAFASLLVLASLGSFLVTRENAADGTDAAAVLAEHRASPVQAGASAPNDASDRDRILVTLASYPNGH